MRLPSNSWGLIKDFYGFNIWSFEIFRKFNDTDYCLFAAQMQTGKTSTYLELAYNMILCNKVKNVVIFSGNRETELRKQTQDRSFKGVQVVWGSQLNSFIPPIEKTLYIWDESHFGQTKGQAVSMFLKKCNLVPGRKGQNGNFLLSVSATPFSELHNIDPYNIIWRKNTKNYWGVRKMLKTNQIVGYNDLRDTFNEVIVKYNTGYSMIRLYESNNENCKFNIIKSILDFKKIKYIIYDRHYLGNIEDVLCNDNNFHTVIILKGKLQMGKTILNKQYIKFCMETTLTKNTDALLQGLIGRFCGYNTNTNTKIYIPDKIKSSGELEIYVNMFINHKDIPKKGMNLRKIKGTTHEEVFY
jgi:hypothetical protein